MSHLPTVYIQRVIALVLGLTLLVGLLDHHAAERVPWHDHLVFDAGGVLLLGRPTHRHAHEHPHEHVPAGAISGADSLGVSPVVAYQVPATHVDASALGQQVNGIDAWLATALPSETGRIAVPAIGAPTEIVLPLPDRPPIAVA